MNKFFANTAIHVFVTALCGLLTGSFWQTLGLAIVFCILLVWRDYAEGIGQ